MALTVEEKIRAALTAEETELWNLIREPHPDVISNALFNRNLTEEMAVFIARRRNATSETLGALAGDVRFRGSYALKDALCRNPGTPQRVVLSLLKFLRIFDLADVSRDQRIAAEIRRKIELVLSEKIPSMPSGVKTALAKRAGSTTLIALMERGDERVICACLESPVLTEGHLYKLINRPSTKAAVIKLISSHAKWSVRYHVRFALIRNYFTPMSAVVNFIRAMKSQDLRELFADPKVPASTKPFIFSALRERGETTETGKEETFNLSEDEDGDLRI